jgi:hypothetical protein
VSNFNRAGLIAAGVVSVLAVGGLGYWLGQSPRAEEQGSQSARAEIPLTDEQASPQSIGRWELQAQFSGPLKDTIVQRWRDPGTGILCYIYLPVVVQHAPPLQNGVVHYGANGTGSISCVKPA